MDAVALSNLPIIPLIQRHASDAAFYWSQRDESITSMHLSLERLAHFDRLLQANLDGLIVARDLGWDAAINAMERWKGTSQLFVCAILALHEKSEARLPILFKRIEAQPNLFARGFISALAWHHQHSDHASPKWILHWLKAATNPLLRAIVLRAAWCVGINCHPYIQSDCIAENSHQRAAAFRALSASRSNTKNFNDVFQFLEKGLSDSSINVRAEAAISLLSYKPNENALNTLKHAIGLLAHQIPLLKGSQIKLAQRKLDRWITQLAIHLPTDREQVNRFLSTLLPQNQILFIAAHGNPAFIPQLLSWAEDTQLAPGALWAIHALTGVDTQTAGIESDGDTCPTSSISKFKTLPTPNPKALAGWWSLHHSIYTNKKRLLIGFELEASTHHESPYVELFLHAPQIIRYIAAQHYNRKNSHKFANVRSSISEQLLFT